MTCREFAYNSRLRFWFIAGALAALMGLAQFTAARQESATFDEGPYIAAGYSHLTARDFRMNLEHPPLAKMLAALPLLPLRPRLQMEHPSWERANLLEFSEVFLYHNRVPAGTMLLAARSVTILLTLVLGLTIATWTRHRFGAAAGLFALFLFATDANFAAHGRYVTNDVALALAWFAAVIAWARYLERKTFFSLLPAGAAFGLALLTKFSAILLIPVFVILYAWKAWQEDSPRLSLDRFLASALVVGVISVALILPAYAFLRRPCEKAPDSVSPNACTLADTMDPRTPYGHFLATAARAFHLPDHPFLIGLFMQYVHTQTGHESYLLGRRSNQGWWYYFPVAFAVKTPSVVVALTLLALLTAAARARRLSLEGLRMLPFTWVILAVPAGVYLLAAMAGRLDLGIRYLLPVYPSLFALLGALVFGVWLPRRRRSGRYLLVALLAAQAAEFCFIYPYHLAFFNTVSGGPGRGPYYLSDSNIDWGQDLIRLKQRLDRMGRPALCLSYFGTAPPEYFGIRFSMLPSNPDQPAIDSLDCVAAVSVTHLCGLYHPPGSFAWIRDRKPFGQVGHSIYLFDLRKRSGLSQPVQAEAAGAGQFGGAPQAGSFGQVFAGGFGVRRQQVVDVPGFELANGAPAHAAGTRNVVVSRGASRSPRARLRQRFNGETGGTRWRFQHHGIQTDRVAELDL